MSLTLNEQSCDCGHCLAWPDRMSKEGSCSYPEFVHAPVDIISCEGNLSTFFGEAIFFQQIV